MDYIEKDELLTALSMIRDENPNWETGNLVLGKIIDTVAQIPASDVRPCARGHWHKDKEHGFVRCSECGDIYPYADYVLAWHFCPNCGVAVR